MKRILLPLKRTMLPLLLCLYAVCVEGQISYSGIRVRRSGSFVDISFEVTAGAKGVRRGEQLLLTPVLYNKSQSVTLPSVAVQSKIAQWQEFRAGKGPGSPDAPAYVIRNREQVVYSTQIPYDEALTNVFLRMERSVLRGGDIYPLSTLQLTRKPFLVSRKVYTLHYGLPAPCPSVGDSLAGYIKVYYTYTQRQPQPSRQLSQQQQQQPRQPQQSQPQLLQQPAPSENVRDAVAQMDKGNYQAALTLLAEEVDAGDGMLDNLTGVCYMMLGDTARSAKCFRKAIAKGNTDAPLNMEQLPSELPRKQSRN